MDGKIKRFVPYKQEIGPVSRVPQVFFQRKKIGIHSTVNQLGLMELYTFLKSVKYLLIQQIDHKWASFMVNRKTGPVAIIFC